MHAALSALGQVKGQNGNIAMVAGASDSVPVFTCSSEETVLHYYPAEQSVSKVGSKDQGRPGVPQTCEPREGRLLNCQALHIPSHSVSQKDSEPGKCGETGELLYRSWQRDGGSEPLTAEFEGSGRGPGASLPGSVIRF